MVARKALGQCDEGVGGWLPGGFGGWGLGPSRPAYVDLKWFSYCQLKDMNVMFIHAEPNSSVKANVRQQRTFTPESAWRIHQIYPQDPTGFFLLIYNICICHIYL